MGAAHTSPDFGVEMVFYHKLGRFVPVLSEIILPEPLATSRDFNYNKLPLENPNSECIWN